MAKETYLEIVRSIVEDLNGLDNPETIYTLDQTVQSTMVKRIVKEAYLKIISSRDWPHLLKFFTLTETDASTPTKLTLPVNIKKVKFLKYNKKLLGGSVDDYQLVKFLEPQRFMDILDMRMTGSIVSWTDIDGIKYKVFNNIAPTYYTSPDEQTIIMDSYDSSVDTTNLLASKTQVYGVKLPDVTVEDSFVFDLPLEMFSLLVAEAKITSFRVINKEVNNDAELHAQTQRLKFEETAWKIRDNFPIRDPNTRQVNNQQQQQQQQRQGTP